MKIHLHHPHNRNASLRTMELNGSGYVLGSAPDTDLHLEVVDQPIGRIQAVIRCQNGRHSFESLSAVATVLINGRPLEPRDVTPLQAEDVIEIGGYLLRLSVENSWAGAAPTTTAATTDTELLNEPSLNTTQASSPEPTDKQEDDALTSLLGGPGVIPVGAPTPPASQDVTEDIFSDDRPTILNQRNPLETAKSDDISAVLGDSTRASR